MQNSDRRSKFSGTLTQLLAAILGTVIAVSDGMNYGWTAPTIPYLISEKSHIKTTKYEAEWLETVLMAGSLVGLPITTYFVDKIGRKPSVLLSGGISALGWITIALADKIVYLFIARFFLGMAGNMVFVAAPMFAAEIADNKIRGLLSGIIYLMMLMGFVIVYSVAPFYPFYVVPLIGAVILILDVILFSFMHESPYYLIYKDKLKEARLALKYYRPGRDIDEELTDISVSIERQKQEKGRIQDMLLLKNNRKAVTIMMTLNIGQHMGAISVILMNLHLILEEGDSIYMKPNTVAITFSVIMLISSYYASMQVDRHGRKALLILSAIVSGICLLVLAIYFNLKLDGYDLKELSWIPIVAVMLYAAGFKLGLGIVPIVITAEIFSAKVKAMGMTLSEVWYDVGSIISLQLYHWLSNSYGLHAPLYLFAICCFLLTIFTVIYIPETKGKTLDEIQLLLKGDLYTSKDNINRKSYNTFVSETCC